jgi:hypothetical protein
VHLPSGSLSGCERPVRFVTQKKIELRNELVGFVFVSGPEA